MAQDGRLRSSITSDLHARTSLSESTDAFTYVLPEDVPGGVLEFPVYARIGQTSSDPIWTLPCDLHLETAMAIALPATSLGQIVSEEEALVATTGVWHRQSVVVLIESENRQSEFCHGQVTGFDVPTRTVTVRTGYGLFTVHQRDVFIAPPICALLLWPFSYSDISKLTNDIHPKLLAALARDPLPDLSVLLAPFVENYKDLIEAGAELPQLQDVRLWMDPMTGEERLTSLGHALAYYRSHFLHIQSDIPIGNALCDDPGLRHHTQKPQNKHCCTFRRMILILFVLLLITYIVYFILMGKVHFREIW
ncbi:hypothetical protein THRCLA_06798 [Thraustotheca clavata]|uniref:Uncharacterized protein n=1 Tax=Thraustotheca clavata TaxID=74557 RepID=A0A1V9ZJ41_9STRA|nr:hypothetical protein THRCLA_06798 [Thraustotheca clavata]